MDRFLKNSFDILEVLGIHTLIFLKQLKLPKFAFPHNQIHGSEISLASLCSILIFWLGRKQRDKIGSNPLKCQGILSNYLGTGYFWYQFSYDCFLNSLLNWSLGGSFVCTQIYLYWVIIKVLNNFGNIKKLPFLKIISYNYVSNMILSKQ